MSKIGLLGGTFDPIHNAHLKMGQAALRQMELDAVVYIPAGNPPHKKVRGASVKDRYNMVKAAVEGKDGLFVSDFEIKKDGPCYSVETVAHFIEKYPEDEFVFIVGEDSLDYVDKWYKPEILLRLCPFAVVGRGGFESDIEKKISFLKAKFGADVFYVKTEEMSVSSSEIRKMIKDGKDVSGLVSKEVLDYINENNLYV